MALITSECVPAVVMSMVMVPVSVLTLILIIFLGFHLYITCTGSTTKALVKKIKVTHPSRSEVIRAIADEDSLCT